MKIRVFLFVSLIGLTTSAPFSLLLACPSHETNASALNAKEEGGRASSFVGTLQTGLMAIGGESTGYGISTPNGQYELSFEEHPELIQKLENWNGKKVKVTGVMTTRRGVEIAVRKIIVVESIKLVE